MNSRNQEHMARNFAKSCKVVPHSKTYNLYQRLWVRLGYKWNLYIEERGWVRRCGQCFRTADALIYNSRSLT